MIINRLLDPEYNVKLGLAHLRELMDDWKGSDVLIVASYNAGGGNVSKWIRAYGDPRSPNVDPIDWIERIPFSETRNYVQRVMEGVLVYRSRFVRTESGCPPTRSRRLSGEPCSVALEADTKSGVFARRRVHSRVPACGDAIEHRPQLLLQ